MNAENRIGWEAENARLLEKLAAVGIDARTFDAWKAEGKWVKRGEKRKAFRVQSGVRMVGIDPISGADRYEPVFKTAYGFTADQVR
jgi:hypothetical protein